MGIPDRRDRVAVLHSQVGLTVAEIAAAEGVSENTIRRDLIARSVFRLGSEGQGRVVPAQTRRRRRSSAIESRRDRVVALYVKAEMTMAEIAAAEAVSDHTVRNDLIARSVPRRKPGHVPKAQARPHRGRPAIRVARVVALHKQGLSRHAIAETVGVSHETVRQDLIAAGEWG